MIDGGFYNPTKIIFGKNAHKQLGKSIQEYGSRVLLLYGGGSIKRNGVYETVTKELEEEGIAWEELGGIPANPVLSKVYEGIGICRTKQIDFILAVGGGSVIDTAKAVSIGAANEGDVWDYFVTPGYMVRDVVPVGCVLTIPAAGSESSIGTVIMNEVGNVKRALNDEIMLPKFAILNPEFTYSLPAYQTAAGISDILAHLLERYFTTTDHTGYMDCLLEASMKAVMAYAPVVLDKPEEYDGRAQIMLMGTIAQNNILNIGMGGDWASHDIQHETSAMFNVAHGAGLAVIFPAWMKYVWQEKPERFIQFATAVMGVIPGLGSKEEVIEEGIHRLQNFFKSIGMPVSLNDLGIEEEDIDMLVEKTFSDREYIGNLKKLDAADVRAIYKLMVVR